MATRRDEYILGKRCFCDRSLGGFSTPPVRYHTMQIRQETQKTSKFDRLIESLVL